MTKVVGFEAREAVAQQAREWLVRLDGDVPLTTAQRLELQEWLNRSPAHREQLMRLTRFWTQANILTELAVPLSAPAAQPKTPPRIPRLSAALLATGVLFVSALVTWWIQRAAGATNGTYGTAIGQQQSIILTDGSSVFLNTDTQVEVIYSNRLRRIRLLQGEALFSVRHDHDRPFDVYVADCVVHATGTAFAVRLHGSNVDVTVTQGAVNVAESTVAQAPAQAATKDALPDRGPALTSLGRVAAGQMATLGARTSRIDVRQLAAPDLRRRMAWHEGYLSFSGEPLSEVVDQLNRYSPIALIIDDPRIASVSIGGRFRIGDLEAVLDVLRSNFGIQARRVDERTVRLESQPTR